MNQFQPSTKTFFFRNGILALAIAGFVLYFIQVSGHRLSANPKAEILEIGIANAGGFQITMWVPSGSTSDSVPGIAHVVEHLKFKANDGAGFVAFDAIPGSSSNAATTYETTRFDLNVPPAGVDKAIESLSAILQPMKITEADLKLEKSIVQQELLQRSQSDPDTPFYKDFYSKLYHGLLYENPPGGTQDSVETVSMKSVLDFDAAHYSGSKLFLLIYGPELSSAQRRKIESAFPDSAIGHISVARNLSMTRDDKELLDRPAFLQQKRYPELTAEEFSVEKTSPRTRTVKLNFAKIVSAPTDRKLVLAAKILRSAALSRLPDGLHDHIAEEPRLVQNWSFSVDRLFDGMWQINFAADVENGVDPKDVRIAMETYLAKLATAGLSSASFERLKERNFLLSEWEEAGSRAYRIGEDTLQFGYASAISLADDLHAAKVEDVNELLKLLQKPGRVGVALLKPEGQTQ